MTDDLQTKIALLEKEINHLDPELSMKVALLEKEVSQYNGLIAKFDLTIDKLTDVSTSLEKLAVVHEQRLTYQEKKTEEIVEKMNDEIKRIVETLDKLAKKEEEHYEDLSTRMHAIEKWKWTVVGGAIVASLLASKVDFSKLFTFIP
jgi:flagellar biosynthesis chaperone FliJ